MFTSSFIKKLKALLFVFGVWKLKYNAVYIYLHHTLQLPYQVQYLVLQY
jgi:hypothetical protein